MSAKDDGGPAFPTQPVPDKLSGASQRVRDAFFADMHGMSLRDYFAAQSIAGSGGWQMPSGTRTTAEEVAEFAYRIADAMLEARKR